MPSTVYCYMKSSRINI